MRLTSSSIHRAELEKTEALNAQAGGLRLIILLCLLTILGAVNTFAITPFFTVMADELNTTVPLLGQTATGMLVSSALVGLVAGPLADHFGHRRVMLIGMFTLLASAFLTVLAMNYAVLLIVRLVGGISTAILLGLPLAVAGTRFTGAMRQRALSWTVAALGAAGVFGIPVLTLVGDAFGWRWAYAVITIVGVIGTVLCWTTMPRDNKSSSAFRMRSIVSAYEPLLRHRPTLSLYGASILRSLCWIGMWTYLGAFLVDEVDSSLPQVSLIFLLGGLGFFLGSLLAGPQVARLNQRKVFAINSVFMGLLIGAFFVVEMNAAIITALLMSAGLLASFAWVAFTTHLANQSPVAPATTMVLNGAVMNLGSAAGGALGGLLLSLGDYGILGIGLAASGIVAGMLVWRPSLGGPGQVRVRARLR